MGAEEIRIKNCNLFTAKFSYSQSYSDKSGLVNQENIPQLWMIYYIYTIQKVNYILIIGVRKTYSCYVYAGLLSTHYVQSRV